MPKLLILYDEFVMTEFTSRLLADGRIHVYGRHDHYAKINVLQGKPFKMGGVVF